MTTKICGCGTEIRFGFTPTGTRIPLEPALNVYQLHGEDAVPMGGLYRNHMITCSRAREFRNRGDRGLGVHVDNSALVHDLLSIVLEQPPSLDAVRSWTPDQRDAAAAWASRVNVGADVPKPEFLEA